MNDIFISYANADRAVAQPLADACEALGWSVWWDREIPFGRPFDQVIEEELNGARCVIVLWSSESARSRWVKTEAAAAADRDRLIPVLIEDVPIPFEFRRIQTAMLQGWSGDREHPEFERLLDSIRHMLGQPARRQPAEGTASPQRPKGRSRMRIRWAWGSGAVLVLLLAALVLQKTGSRSTESISSPGTEDAAAVSASPSKSAGASRPDGTRADPATAAANGLPISIGDRIEDGVPAAGAGNIESAGAKDAYRFEAKARQRVYFRMLEHGRGMSQISWKVTDPDGAEVFATCLGCSEPGVHTLRKAGTYTLTVGSDRDPATGPYRLQLFDVAPPHQFSLKIGDEIKDNAPGAGAGHIETPGAQDVYTFAAAAGQRVFFRLFEHGKGMEQIKWKLTDAEDAEIFDTCLGCGQTGAHTLRKGGRYRLTIGSLRVPASGLYRAQLLNVPPPDRFAIKVGDAIKENTPARGAGDIESPGARDIYTFTASAGERVYFRMLEHAKGMAQIRWKLTDSDGNDLFDTCLGCSQPGVHALRKGGLYTLTIGSDRDPATGPYRVQLSGVPGA